MLKEVLLPDLGEGIESADVSEVLVSVGDSVYLFSDGYPDQFGGLKGKKYMKGKMKKFVLSVQNQSVM